MACQFLGLECQVFMVRVSYDQKPYRRALIDYLAGKLRNYEYPDEEIAAALSGLPAV